MVARRLLLALVGVCVLAGARAGAGDPWWAAPASPAQPADCQRVHVYVFMVNGLDPFYLCRLNKMRDDVQAMGYEHVYLGQLSATRRFTREVRRIRAEDANARIVLIGFSLGANNVCRMADELGADGLQVDLLVYLGGCLVSNGPEWRPRNAGRIVNIRDGGLVVLTGGLFAAGDDIDGVDNVKIPGVAFHLGTPESTTTQDTLARELTAQAAAVPATTTTMKP